ncbi:MAG: hypothetical protein IPG96_19880 [Proteobacteria bacterium]|nr:hypothetical protein [Pseudomonadota bacterium]
MARGAADDEAEREATIVRAVGDAAGEATLVGTLDDHLEQRQGASPGTPGERGRPWGEIEAEWQRRLATARPDGAALAPHREVAFPPGALWVELDVPPLSPPLAEGMPPLPTELGAAGASDAADWSDEPTPGPSPFASTTGRLAALTERDDAPGSVAGPSPTPAPLALADRVVTPSLEPIGRHVAQTAELPGVDQAAAPWSLGTASPRRAGARAGRGWGWILASAVLLLAAVVAVWWILGRAGQG